MEGLAEPRFFIADLRPPHPTDNLLLWRPDGAGYTYDADRAGRYTRREYEERVAEADRATHVLIPIEKALAVTRRVVPAYEVGL